MTLINPSKTFEENLEDIAHADYGKEVRPAMHDGLLQMADITGSAAAAANAAAETANNAASAAEDMAGAAFSATQTAMGGPVEVDTAAEMVNTTQIYVYRGSETGYQAGHWYYYNASVSAWADGGEYKNIAVDPTLTISGAAADAYQTGLIKNELNDLIEYSKNIFDGAWIEGYFINQVTGVAESSSLYHATDYITVDEGSSYAISNKANVNFGIRYAFYNSSKTFISGDLPTTARQYIVNAPANAEYIRFSVASTVDNVQLEKGSAATEYEPYYKVLKPELVWSPAIQDDVDNAIDDKLEAYEPVIKPENTTFFDVSKNMINPATCIDGEFVNNTNGAFASNSLHTRTDYIAIEPGVYVLRGNNGPTQFRYAMYNSNHVYITGDFMLPDNNMLITAPEATAYIVVSYSSHTPAYWMLAKYENESTAFVEYYEYIKPEYLRNPDDSLIMNLPKKVYALAGYEMNIYFENIVEDWTKYKWNCTCSIGEQMERGYRLTPAANSAGGMYTLTIEASGEDGNTYSATTAIIVSPASAGQGTTKRIIILGDSTTANGIAVTKLNENFSTDSMNAITEGTQGTAPNQHEGRSGWTFASYFEDPSEFTVDNAFYNPSTGTFDASYYYQETGITPPDWFFINLGINDTFAYTSDSTLSAAIATIKGRCDLMIQSIKAANANTKVGLCLTIPPNHSQDAFGKAYKCGQTRDRYKRNNLLWVHDLISTYGDRENENIYLVPLCTNLDTVYNMGLEEIPVNARNERTYLSPIANGGVHPVTSGYWQIADIYIAFIKGNV